MTQNALFARLAFTLMAIVTGVHAFWMYEGLRDAREAIDVQVGMRRLAALTIRNFPERNLVSADLFWKSIGRETPIKDAWGTDYFVEITGSAPLEKIFWRCAGPDRRWKTHDDINVEVPYSNAPLNDFDPSDASRTVPGSTDAK